ncbi:MAG TPA: dihydrolipoyl dehydrogenase [Solirubrobacteraceae bacterium]|nr:dihydrolipoyl dehydrogenase [Solirubrobacteraceae bacterium]
MSTAGAEPGEPGAETDTEIHAQLLVLGSGPGGYTAAFRAADLGLDVVLVEREETLGGVCLNVGCIPSKALLHIAKVIADAERASAHGVSFGAPQIELEQLRSWKDGVVGRLTTGLAGLARQRKVRVVRGEGHLTGPHTLTVAGTTVTFDHAVLATGSRAVRLDGIPHDDPRVMSSTDALALADIPERLLVVGGGIVGLELAGVYDALGSSVTVVELSDQLMPGCDPDLVAPLHRRLRERYAGVHLRTRVESIEASDAGLLASFTAVEPALEPAVFDRVLVAVGRVPNSESLGLENAGVAVDERGFVTVDAQQRTSTPHIHAIGDLVGPPLLAHKAAREAKVAAEVIAGHDVELDVRGIPSVAYTDPEVAWVGLTETAAKLTGVAYRSASFPWSASGRALASDGQDGITKLILDPETNRVLGAGIVGNNAGELIAEPGLALELETDSQDIALTVHAHPTLSETIAMAAEIADGTITDLPPARR